MKHHRRSHEKKSPPSRPSLLERMSPNAAGVDCGSAAHYVAVPPDRDAAPVRSFTPFSTDLRRLADWLPACGITTVAMESTGVYWIPLYEILEARGLDVVLVNARHVKNVSRRKTDVVDCQWLQELHSVGLLRGSFRPTASIAALRLSPPARDPGAERGHPRPAHAEGAGPDEPSAPHRDQRPHRRHRAAHSPRHHHGADGPHALAQNRDHRYQASEAEITAALTGHYRPEHVFVL